MKSESELCIGCRPGALVQLVFVLIASLWSGWVTAEPGEASGHSPGVVDLRPRFESLGLPIRSQGGRGTCSVFAMTGAIEYALASQQRTGTVMSVEFLNWAANQTRQNQRDGGFFSEIWSGFETNGICAETNLPYRVDYDSRLQPDLAIRSLARTATNAHLRLEWIKPWDVTTGLTESQFQEIKRILASGWPVCAGLRWPKHENWHDNVLQMAAPEDVFDGHSVILVGFKEDSTRPGGGIFLVRNSGGGARDGAMPYAYARAYINDAVWIGVGKNTAPWLDKRSIQPNADEKH